MTTTGGRLAVRRAMWLLLAATAPVLVAVAVRPFVTPAYEADAAFVLVLVVLAASTRGGLLPPLVAAVSAFAAYEALVVDGADSVLADAGVLVGLLAVAVVVAALIRTADRRRVDALTAATEAALLEELAVSLAEPGDPVDEVRQVAELARERLGLAALAVVRGGSPPTVLHDGGLGGEQVLNDWRRPPARLVTSRTVSTGSTEVTVLAYPPRRTVLSARSSALLRAVAGRVAAAVARTLRDDEHRRLVVLEASDRQRSALLSSVSHDLRTPLSAIKASATALAAPDLPDAERAQLSQSIVVESDRLDRMVRNLLALSRIESGRLVARREPVPVDELVGSVLTRLRSKIRGRRLEVDVPYDLPPVLVDAVQIEQVVGNLVENVLAHTPVNAGLIVRAHAVRGRVNIRVADEGPGIPANERRRVFERFGRGSHAGPGSGLGLAIARAYAEANGGSLELAEDTDCGAAFDVWLEAAEVRT